jgi:two-component system KDP operon response regulator KdpE
LEPGRPGRNVGVDLGNRVSHSLTGEDVKPTPLEHRVLECLARHADVIVTHRQLLKEVCGPRKVDGIS